MRKRVFFTGGVAGLAGAYAMQLFRTAWNRHYAAMPRHGVFGLDREADLTSVNNLTKLLGRQPFSESRSEQIALVLHYAYGVAAGAAYSAISEKFPTARVGYGTVFGIAIWIFGDELPITLLKISSPWEHSARSHASAFAAHLLFGVVLELTRSAQRALLIN